MHLDLVVDKIFLKVTMVCLLANVKMDITKIPLNPTFVELRKNVFILINVKHQPIQFLS